MKQIKLFILFCVIGLTPVFMVLACSKGKTPSEVWEGYVIILISLIMFISVYSQNRK